MSSQQRAAEQDSLYSWLIKLPGAQVKLKPIQSTTGFYYYFYFILYLLKFKCHYDRMKNKIIMNANLLHFIYLLILCLNQLLNHVAIFLSLLLKYKKSKESLLEMID